MSSKSNPPSDAEFKELLAKHKEVHFHKGKEDIGVVVSEVDSALRLENTVKGKTSLERSVSIALDEKNKDLVTVHTRETGYAHAAPLTKAAPAVAAAVTAAFSAAVGETNHNATEKLRHAMGDRFAPFAAAVLSGDRRKIMIAMENQDIGPIKTFAAEMNIAKVSPDLERLVQEARHIDSKDFERLLTYGKAVTIGESELKAQGSEELTKAMKAAELRVLESGLSEKESKAMNNVRAYISNHIADDGVLDTNEIGEAIRRLNKIQNDPKETSKGGR